MARKPFRAPSLSYAEWLAAAAALEATGVAADRRLSARIQDALGLTATAAATRSEADRIEQEGGQ